MSSETALLYSIIQYSRIDSSFVERVFSNLIPFQHPAVVLSIENSSGLLLVKRIKFSAEPEAIIVPDIESL
jgi:hypothetical protein